MLGSGIKKLIILNKEINDIKKTVKSHKESSLLIKCVCETIKNKAKEQRRGFLDTLLGAVGAILLGTLLTSKGVMRARENMIRAGQHFYSRNILLKMKDGVFVINSNEKELIET